MSDTLLLASGSKDGLIHLLDAGMDCVNLATFDIHKSSIT
jgi:hypothetical protein